MGLVPELLGFAYAFIFAHYIKKYFQEPVGLISLK